MANPEHVEALKTRGAKAFNNWRTENNLETLDLAEIRFSEACRIGITVEGRDYRSHGDDLNLRKADLAKTSFRGVSLKRAVCVGATFTECDMRNTVFYECDFREADFTGACCREAVFEKCNLTDACIGQVDFLRAVMRDVELEGVRDADTARHLETIRGEGNLSRSGLKVQGLAPYWVSWDMIRKIGRLRMFAVSVSLLGIFMVAIQWVGIYNDHVNGILGWAEQLASNGNLAQQLLGQQIQEHLKPFHFSTSTCWLFGSIVLLGIASTIYAFACPDEIKEFTRSHWEHAMGKNILYYWALAWKYPTWRCICAFFYAVGGVLFLGLTAWKLGLAFWYILGYGQILPF